jgi:uncharacterized membrane protein YfcA
MFGLAVLFGCGVGFALGLTGGGGGVFAVPLLVYGLSIAPREAVGIWLGGLVAKRLNGPTLQRVFASAVVLVAVFVIAKTVVL